MKVSKGLKRHPFVYFGPGWGSSALRGPKAHAPGFHRGEESLGEGHV